MTHGDRIRAMNDDHLAEYILRLIKGGEDDYEYRCTNCPVTNCELFEPEERCCWATVSLWLEEEECM